MREDMFKIIVEPARKGGRHSTKSKLRLDRCEERTRVTGRRLVSEKGGAKKWNRVSLSPLKRYLDKQVGRKWDEVHSEIFSHVDGSDAIKSRMQGYIDRFVKCDIWYDRHGMLRCAGEWYYDGDPSCWWTRLYVDPADGVLKRTKDLCKSLGLRPRRKTNAQIRENHLAQLRHEYLKRLSATRYLAKLSGIWYEIQISGAVVSVFGHPLSLAQLHEDLENANWRNHKCWSVVKKSQLNKKTLGLHKLFNDPDCSNGGVYG